MSTSKSQECQMTGYTNTVACRPGGCDQAPASARQNVPLSIARIRWIQQSRGETQCLQCERALVPPSTFSSVRRSMYVYYCSSAWASTFRVPQPVRPRERWFPMSRASPVCTRAHSDQPCVPNRRCGRAKRFLVPRHRSVSVWSRL